MIIEETGLCSKCGEDEAVASQLLDGPPRLSSPGSGCVKLWVVNETFCMNPHQLTTLLNSLSSAHAGDLRQTQPVATSQRFWQWTMLAQALAPALLSRNRRIVAISGSQGSGKSTLAKILVEQLREQGKTAACVSLDDFYLPKQTRVKLAQEVHPLLATRGVPGTHDSSRLRHVLEQFESTLGLVTVDLPVFDKGLDDRVADTQVQAELLIVEGWCLGVQPQDAALLAHPINDLERAEDTHSTWRRWSNQQIQQHYLPLWPLINEWILLEPPGFAQVQQWRRQQEMDLPSDQRMSEPALQRFIQHYQRLTEWQWQHPIKAPGLRVELTPDHEIKDIHSLEDNS